MNSLRLSLAVPSITIPSPPVLSPISSASTRSTIVRNVPSYQINQASLRDIRFNEISNENLLFQVRQMKAQLSVFASLPLKIALHRTMHQTNYVIDWNAMGLPDQIVPQEFQQEPMDIIESKCKRIQDWFIAQVGQVLSLANPLDSYRRFEQLQNRISRGVTYNLPADLRVSSPFTQLRQDIFQIVDTWRVVKYAMCHEFTVFGNPIHGEPNIFNVLSDVQNIVESAIAFQNA